MVGTSHGAEISVGVRSGMVGGEGDKGKKDKNLPGAGRPIHRWCVLGELICRRDRPAEVGCLEPAMGPGGRGLKLLSSPLLPGLEVLDLDLQSFSRELTITSRTQGRGV